jgi:uncharacterized protein (DUF1697 family)
METYISLLRGINVSGQKKVNMRELKAVYESLGFDNVRTYIQSGNVVFNYKKTPVKKLIADLEKAIAESFRFDVPVQIRTRKEMHKVIAENPFMKEKGLELEKHYVIFLAEEPGKAQLEKINDLSYPPERFVISGTTIYFYCPNGYGNAKLNNNLFESKLKVSATTRNWKTVNVLAEME